MSVLDGPGEGMWSVFAMKVVEERDALREEVAKLRAERRQLCARLVECRPWVGVCPYPNTPGFTEMMAIRDIVDDTLLPDTPAGIRRGKRATQASARAVRRSK
jgi:hypothetical protein